MGDPVWMGTDRETARKRESLVLIASSTFITLSSDPEASINKHHVIRVMASCSSLSRHKAACSGFNWCENHNISDIVTLTGTL